MRYDCYNESTSFIQLFLTSRLVFFGIIFLFFFFLLYSTAKSCANCAEFLNFSTLFATRIAGDSFFFCRSNWISCAELGTQFWFGLSLMCNKTERTKKFLTGQNRWHKVKRDILPGEMGREKTTGSSDALSVKFEFCKVFRISYNRILLI